MITGTETWAGRPDTWVFPGSTAHELNAKIKPETNGKRNIVCSKIKKIARYEKLLELYNNRISMT